MKDKIIIFIPCMLLILTSMSISKYEPWELVDHSRVNMWGYNSPVTQFNRCLECSDNNNCVSLYALNIQWAYLRMTTDKGNSWFTALIDTVIYYRDEYGDKVSTYVPPDVNDLDYYGNRLCIISCDSGYYYISKDNCVNWDIKRVETEPDYNIVICSIYNDSIWAFYNYNSLLLTKDAGESWDACEFNLDSMLVPRGITCIEFIDENSIVLCASNYTAVKKFIYTSYDFGTNWNLKQLDTVYLRDIQVINEKHIWIAGGKIDTTKSGYNYKDYIIYSSDKGHSWDIQLDTFITKEGLWRISFADEKNGLALSLYRRLWRTSDGGEHWFIDSIYTIENMLENSLRDIFFTEEGTVFANGYESGKIFRYKFDLSSIYAREDNKNNYFIHPNPATSQITLSLGEEFISEPEIDIIDYLGNVKRWTPSGRWSPSEKSITINTSSLSPGVYFLRVRSGEKVEVRKFVVI
jgi:photosystem II stability/assembly factor-like uncharacterized protein